MKKSTKPKKLIAREKRLILMFTQCQLQMTPIQFYAKWEVSYDIIAQIATRSDSTVRGSFKQGRYRRYPKIADLRQLALMDFVLEHFEDIPQPLWSLLCERSPQ